MRGVAVEACGRAVWWLFVVTRFAPDGVLSRRERVRWVATCAGGGGVRRAGRRRMRDALGMAGAARDRRTAVVGGVTARARRVRCGGEDGRGCVARPARRDRCRREFVWRVAARAARMLGRQRGLRDVVRAAQRGVASRASSVGDELRLVHRVAVETAARAAVSRLPLLVTGCAWLGHQRRSCVCAMAVTARLIGMRTDGDVSTLRRCVTAHARRRRPARVGAKAVTVLAEGARLEAQRIVGVERRRLRAMALLAQICGRLVERGTVAALAGQVELADVCGVARAGAHVPVRLGDVLRRARAPVAACSEHEQRDREEASHRRAPSGWHIRHGIDDSGSSLVKPGGCGFPPTPPTAWQPTQSCSPAPP